MISLIRELNVCLCVFKGTGFRMVREKNIKIFYLLHITCKYNCRKDTYILKKIWEEATDKI